MPKHPSWLLPAESAAGLQDDEDFLIHVADILHNIFQHPTRGSK